MSKKEENGGATPATLRKRKVAMLALGGLFLFIAIVWLIYWLIWGQFEEYTDDAYVSGNLVQLMAQIPGTVVEVHTENTQLVKEGQAIIKMDQADYAIALQKAKADLGQTVRQVRQYFENAAQARQNVILDKANLVKAQLDVKRRKGLVGNRAVSREEMQHYQTALDAAQASYNASLRQLDAANALVENTNLYNHPLVETAKANLKNAYLNFQRTTVVAPVSGFIAKRAIHPGQQIAQDTAMLAIVPLHDTWVDANYKESSLEHIRVGQPVILYADAYPGITYHGKVLGLNAGTGSAFSLLPPQNATGNWIKIVQRLPVRIQLDEKEVAQNPLQIGLSMRVTVDTSNRDGSRMPTTNKTLFKYKTTVFADQLAKVDTLIDDILKANSPDMSLPKADKHD
ncbi:efflux RND transporter periplasmic adaptor subunit [Legionella lytica]|uniref:Efflux RND transporter periplasmic adaptor subunit n=1 Tax=Legionella lytica TaxID=96232 RepID=A0ABW8DBI6_9GAMM